jgi:hypothetical protein
MKPNRGPAPATVLVASEIEGVDDGWTCGRGGAKALAKPAAASSSAAQRRATGKVRNFIWDRLIRVL